jgi:hypothetical protein
MITNLFMAILSRNPSSDEMATALKDLQSGARATEAVNLVWQLYNKVDFMFQLLTPRRSVYRKIADGRRPQVARSGCLSKGNEV